MRIIQITGWAFFLASNRLNWCRKAKQIVDNFKYPYFGGCGMWMVDRDREIAALAPKSVGSSDSALWDRQMCGARRQADGAENPCHEPLTGFPTPAQRCSGRLRMCRAAVSGQIGLFSYGSSNTASNEQIIKRLSPYRMCKTPYILHNYIHHIASV